MALTEESEHLDLNNAFAAKFESEYEMPEAVHTFVKEADVLHKYISDMIGYTKGSGLSDKQAFDIRNRVYFILTQYQEQAGLLDSHLESLLEPIMARVQEVCRDLENIPANFNYLLEIVYTIVSVRGHTTVVKFFPHEVSDLEPAFGLLNKFLDQSMWQSQCVLILWLSMIVLVPFDLATIDSTGDLVSNMISLCKTLLESTGKTRDFAAIFVGKFLTRPDMQTSAQEFLSWGIALSATGSKFLLTGVLHTVEQIFTHGQRPELLSLLPNCMPFLDIKTENAELSKYKAKLASRLALTLLRPIVIGWRYQRGSRSLANTIGNEVLNDAPMITNCEAPGTLAGEKVTEEDEEEEFFAEDVDLDILEKLIDSLLSGLKDRNTIVRWAAAKGIGRVTGRLTMDLADQITEQMLELFSPRETDHAWHGGCLALAELSRRGLLHPNRFPQVFPLLQTALLYDKQHGSYSVGAHVRDAACYLSWSFARAYAPEDLSTYLPSLAQTLMIVELFDREVNCRKAASAAFQEFVGRQGSFPHGIEILAEADYFTLGNRTHAYLQVSCFVAQFEEYREILIWHLVNVNLQHWDTIIRQLSACALSVLLPFAPDLFINEIIPKLVSLCLHDNLFIRHGAILGLAECVIGLAGKSAVNNDPKMIEKFVYKHSINYYLLSSKDKISEQDKKILKDSENRTVFKQMYSELQQENHMQRIDLEAVKNVVPQIEKKRLFRGKGGMVQRIAVCRFLECFAFAEVQLSATQIMNLQGVLNDCVNHPNDEVQDAAQAAFREFSKVYHNAAAKSLLEKTLYSYLKPLDEFNAKQMSPANLTRGGALALGGLNKNLLAFELERIVAVLTETCKLKNNKDLDDAETRKHATYALGSILTTLLQSNTRENPGGARFKEDIEIPAVNFDYYVAIFDALLMCMEDYHTDRRGDVGSWVRGGAMNSIVNIFDFKEPSDSEWLIVANVLLQQLCEKIDKLRQLAGMLMETFITRGNPPEAITNHLHPIFINNQSYIENYQENCEKYTEYLPDSSDLPTMSATSDYKRGNLYSVPTFIYPLVMPLIHIAEYQRSVIIGVIVSTGGITESTTKSACESLVAEIKKDPQVCFVMLEIYQQEKERLIIPFMKTWEILFRDCRELQSLEGLGRGVFDLTKKLVTGCKDIHRSLAAVGVFSVLMDNPAVSHDALNVMVNWLCQAFPKVRALVSQNLHSWLLAADELASPEVLDEVMTIIETTSWVLPLKEIRPVRNKLYPILKLTPPAPAAKKTEEKTEESKESYGDLVREMGY